MGGGDLSGIRVDTVFERFPASVRGAVVVRGRDPDPHHVRLTDAYVVEASSPSKPVRSLDLGEVVVDVAPRRDVMIPFEVPFAGLEPGWYEVRAEAVVDGQQQVSGPPEDPPRFVVAWPGGTMRRGRLDPGLRIDVPGSEGVVIERVDLKTDAAVIHWRHAPGEDPGSREFGDLRVGTDGRPLPILEDRYDWSTGARTTTTYPVPKDRARLEFTLDRRHLPDGTVGKGPWSAGLDLP